MLISIILRIFFPLPSLCHLRVFQVCLEGLISLPVSLIMEQNHINNCNNSQIGARKLLLLSNMLHEYSEMLYTEGLLFFSSPFSFDVFLDSTKCLTLSFAEEKIKNTRVENPEIPDLQ